MHPHTVKDRWGQKRTFMAPNLFCPITLGIFIRMKLPYDIWEAFFCLVEERLKVVLPRSGRVVGSFFEEGGRRSSGRGHGSREEKEMGGKTDWAEEEREVK